MRKSVKFVVSYVAIVGFASSLGQGEAQASDLHSNVGKRIYTFIDNDTGGNRTVYDGSFGVTESYGAVIATGSNGLGTPFTQISASTTNAQALNQIAETILQYQWRAVGGDQSTPVLVHATTSGWIDANYGYSPYSPGQYNLYMEVLSVEARATFATATFEGVNTVSSGLYSGSYNGAGGGQRLQPTGTVDSRYGGTAYLQSNFSDSFDFWVVPSAINTVTLEAGLSGPSGNESFALKQYSRVFYDVKAFVDPVFTVDAAYADRYSIEVASIPFVGVPAVPEPETYALMFGGLLAMGFVARRRRSDIGRAQSRK